MTVATVSCARLFIAPRQLGDGPDDFLLNGAREDLPIGVREFPTLGEVTLLNGDTGLPL